MSNLQEYCCSGCGASVQKHQVCDLCEENMCKNCEIYGYDGDHNPIMSYHRFCINKPENPWTGEMMEREYKCSVCQTSGDTSDLRGCNADGCKKATHRACGIRYILHNGSKVYGCPTCLST